MAEQHSIGFTVDASKGEAGSKKFKKAIDNISAALVKLETTSTKAFKSMDADFDGKSFKKFNAAVSLFNTNKVSAASINRIVDLSVATKGFRAPTQAQTKNLRAFNLALSRMKSPRGAAAITKLSIALKDFKAPTKRQTNNLVGFIKALDGLKVPNNANAIAKALLRIASAAGRASTRLSGLRGNVSSLGLNKLASQTRVASKGMMQFGTSMNFAHQGGSVLRNVLGALTLGEFARSLFTASNAVQTFAVTMETVTGSASSARTDLAFVRQTAQGLAIDLRTAQEQFASFAAASNVAGLEAATTRDIFKSVSVAMTVLNRSTQDQELSFLALQQMISKGTVSSEELRRQLGERLPGALEIMARSLKVSGAELNKMLKAGSISSKDALPKFAKELMKIFGSGVPAALERTSSQIKLLRNDFELLFLDVGDAGFMSGLTTGVKELRVAISSEEFKEFAKAIGANLGGIVRGTASAIGFMAENTSLLVSALKVFVVIKATSMLGRMTGATNISSMSLKRMAVHVRTTSRSLKGMSVASKIATVSTFTLTNALRGLKLALGPVGLAFLAFEVAVAVFDRSSETGIQKSAEFANVLNTLGSSAESAQVALEKLSQADINLLKFDISVATPLAEKDVVKSVERLKKKLKFVSRQIGAFFSDSLGDASKSSRELFLDLSKQFDSGAISATTFQQKLLALAAADPNLGEVTTDLSELVKAVIKAEGVVKSLAGSNDVLAKANTKVSKTALELFREMQASARMTGTNASLVKKYVKAFEQADAPVKNLAANIASLRQAQIDYNEALAKKPVLDSAASEKAHRSLLKFDLKELTKLTNDLSVAKNQEAIKSKLVTEAIAKNGIASREAREAMETEAQNKRNIISLGDQLVASEESLFDVHNAIAESSKGVADGIANYAANLAAGIANTKELDRQINILVDKGLTKFAPKLAKSALEATRMKEAQEFLNTAMAAGRLTAPQVADAMDEYGKNLGTAATAGLRAADTWEKVKSRIAAAGKKQDLGGEDLARFESTNPFRVAGEGIAEDLKTALASGIATNIAIAQGASDEFDAAMVKIGDAAGLAFRNKNIMKAFKGFEADDKKFDRETNSILKLLGRNDELVKSRTELAALQKLGILGDKQQAAVLAELGVDQTGYNALLAKMIQLKKDETEPGRVYIEQLDEEIALLKLSDEARRAVSIARQVELDFQQRGIDLTKKENLLLLENAKAKALQVDAMSNPKGFQAFVSGVGTMESALNQLDQKIATDLTDTFANFIITGKINFGDFARSIIADMAHIVAQQAFKSLFKGVLGGLFGGGGKGVGFLGSLFGSAKGNAFVNGMPVKAFAKGGVVDQPTLFSAKNGMNVMGEVPGASEGILPLKRMSNGDLGVQASGGRSEGGMFIYNSSIAIDMSSGGGGGGMTPEMADQLSKTLDMSVEKKVREVIIRAKQPGGMMNKGVGR